MRIVTNHKLIKRNRKIGQITTIASLAILIIGLVISFTPDPNTFMWSFVALIAGFMLSQIGIFFGNRWGRSPRADEYLVQALKGLDDKYTLYNFTTAVSHLLVGPAGIWVFCLFNQPGTITYDEKKNRWAQKSVNIYRRWFMQEGIGRPEQEVQVNLNDIHSFMEKNANIENLPTASAAMVFTHPKAEIQAEEAPIPTLHLEKLKDFIRRQAKTNPADLEAIYAFQDLFPSESIE